MASDSRARLIVHLCQAGLSTARANAVLDDYASGLAEKIRTEGPDVIRPWFNYYASDGTQPTHAERVTGAAAAVASLVSPGHDARG